MLGVTFPVFRRQNPGKERKGFRVLVLVLVLVGASQMGARYRCWRRFGVMPRSLNYVGMYTIRLLLHPPMGFGSGYPFLGFTTPTGLAKLTRIPTGTKPLKITGALPIFTHKNCYLYTPKNGSNTISEPIAAAATSESDGIITSQHLRTPDMHVRLFHPPNIGKPSAQTGRPDPAHRQPSLS